jgi:hypothetical protein
MRSMLALLVADNCAHQGPKFQETHESAADDVQLLTCPKCGHTFPK